MPPLTTSPRLVSTFGQLLWNRPNHMAFRVILPLCFVVFGLLPPQATAQGTCNFSPSTFNFSQSGGGPQTGTMTCTGNLQTVLSYLYTIPVGVYPVSSVGSVSSNNYDVDSRGNTNCSTQTDYYFYVSWTDGITDVLSYVPVATAGVGGRGCQISGDVPNGLAPPSPSDPQATTNEPISTGTGNYYYQHTDLTVSGLVPLRFVRTYNSQDLYSGALGANWTHSYNITLGASSSGAVIKWGDGHGENYTLSNGVYFPTPGVTGTLAQDSYSGVWTLTSKDGTSLSFNPWGKLEIVKDRNGNETVLVYDNNWNLIQIDSNPNATLNLSYDPSGQMTQVSDGLGRTVSYSYDAKSNLISETDPNGSVTKYAYDSSHRLTSITLPNKSVLMRSTYDSSSRVISQTNARGYKTTLAYNMPAQGQTTITDPLGNSTIHTYDLSMRITGITGALGHTTSYTYDTNNDVISVTDARGNATNLTYDSLGNVLTYTDPLGNNASFTYNSFSEPLTVTTPNANTTTLTYDATGNLTTAQNPLSDKTVLAYDTYGDVVSVTDARNNTTTLSYDYSQGLLLTGITDPLGNNAAFAYDTIGRLTSVTDPNLHTTSVAYDPLSRIISVSDPLSNQTQFGYDSVSNLTSVTDANQHATAYAYDHVGNLTQVTDPLGHETKYTYDKNNNRIDFTNASGKATKYTYDTTNRLVKITEPLSLSTSYGLDPVGNVTALTDANGKTNTFTFDADNRLTNASYSDGRTVAYTYDPDSNRASMVDPHGTTSYSYDALDRVLSVVFPGTSSVQYAYDPVGNRSSLTYPDKSALTFAYDADNRLSGVTDWLARNTSYAYDPASNLTGIAFPNTATSALNYDASNRLTGISDSANSVAYRVLAYALDGVGNRAAVIDGGAATNYTYDAVNELLTAQSGAGASSWTYDPVGNRTQQVAPSGTTKYTYDAENRMLTAGSTKFTYDHNGNRLTQSGTSGKTTYAYDANNRLLSAAAPTGTSSFSYDGDGNRITQTTPAGTYSYANDTANGLPVVLNEQGPDGAIDYAYGLGLTESSSSAFNYFYNLDGLGSVSNLTNSAGTVQETYSYDAWGNALTATGDVGTQNKFRFTGQALDPASGLYFLRARYYDQSSGRLLSKDPFSGFAGFPLTTHRYIYAGNNPVKFVDPTGQRFGDDDIGFLTYGAVSGLVGQLTNDWSKGHFSGGWSYVGAISTGALTTWVAGNCAEAAVLCAGAVGGAGGFVNYVSTNGGSFSLCEAITATSSGAVVGGAGAGTGLPTKNIVTSVVSGILGSVLDVGSQASAGCISDQPAPHQPAPEGAPQTK
jgi:RHS repeat-associated protein